MGDIWKPCVTPLSGDQLGGRKGNQFDRGGEHNRKEKEKKKRKKGKRKERKEDRLLSLNFLAFDGPRSRHCSHFKS